jgi:hypothetical protein
MNTTIFGVQGPLEQNVLVQVQELARAQRVTFNDREAVLRIEHSEPMNLERLHRYLVQIGLLPHD